MRDETMSNSTTAPLIEIRNLWRHYPAGEEQIAVLKGVDLTIERGAPPPVWTSPFFAQAGSRLTVADLHAR